MSETYFFIFLKFAELSLTIAYNETENNKN